MADAEKLRALESAHSHIDKQYGKGSIMRFGESTRTPVEFVPTG